MKITNPYPQRQFVVPFAFICMTLTGLLSPVAVYSASIPAAQTSATQNNLSKDNKSLSPNHNIALVKNKSGQKKILVEESRGLSAFFIIGIGINIIMVITFAWWFSSEWRKTKK